MAMTLTSLIPDFYAALDTVSREQVGFIPAVLLDANDSRAALGQTIRSFVAPASTATDITAGVTPPNTGGQTIGSTTMTISKARAVPLQWTGEEQNSVNGGHGYGSIFQKQIAQAIRTLCNEVESDIAGLHVSASRAYGAATTTPFASTLTDTAQVRKILADNGSPMTDLQLVIDSTAGANMRTLTQLNKANESGDVNLLRQGVLLDVHGFAIRESAQIKTSTAGTAASATTNAAGYAVGATSITLAAVGTGTLVAGDVITFAGDANKYVVKTGTLAVSGAVIEIAAPGLKVAMSAATKAITVIAAATRNLAFQRDSIVLLARAPAIPAEGDQATDAMVITDDRSGLSFEVRMYKGYRQVHYEIALAWGASVVKPEHTAILLG